MIETANKNIDIIEIIGAEREEYKVYLNKKYSHEKISIYRLVIESNREFEPNPITLRWKIPAHNIKGVWKPTTDFNKRIMDDWELDHMTTRISVDSPVICLFGHDDTNIQTFACSDAINTLELNALYREEDNLFYCHITFFPEKHEHIKYYEAEIYIDDSHSLFSESLKAVSRWWETFENLKPSYVPAYAKVPLYSTWYQFHQSLDKEVLIDECTIAHSLGYKLIIIDDGWQTKDSNRGYDYTGDWEPERIPDIADFIQKIHALGMKVGLWFSVPFCGKKSKAYKRFKGKFLTENHRWAPVFDPRYPEVREYLISIYTKVAKEWGVDGFKLDFIDEFRVYENTVLTKEDGRDFASINKAVDRLMTDVMVSLKQIDPEVFIEFRQKYIGPAMRKFGNMFRAFDCPGDSTMNRVRIADLKMLSGNTSVHSDPLTWHIEEPLHIAALQIINSLFGVPQLSVILKDTPQSQLKMIKFYTQYWNEHNAILLEGDFTPIKPLANYPLQYVCNANHMIVGVYDETIVILDDAYEKIDIINAKVSNTIIIKAKKNLGDYNYLIHDCQGAIIKKESIILEKGVLEIKTPPCGMIRFNS